MALTKRSVCESFQNLSWYNFQWIYYFCCQIHNSENSWCFTILGPERNKNF